MEKFYKVVNDSCNKMFVKVTDKMPDHALSTYRNGGYIYVTSVMFTVKNMIAHQFENCIDCRIEKEIVKREEFELRAKVFNYIEISESEYNRAKDTLTSLKESVMGMVMNL